jgi:hypothetical protein
MVALFALAGFSPICAQDDGSMIIEDDSAAISPKATPAPQAAPATQPQTRRAPSYDSQPGDDEIDYGADVDDRDNIRVLEEVGESPHRSSTVSSQSYGTLRSKAIAGSTLYFVGMGGYYALQFVTVSSQEELLMMLIPIGITTGLKVAGAPVACTQASKAYDICRMSGRACARNNVWGYYRGGWAFGAASGLCTLISSFASMGSSVEAAVGFTLAGLGLGIGRDVFWSIACIKSNLYVRNSASRDSDGDESSISVVPTVCKGGAGLQMNLSF